MICIFILGHRALWNEAIFVNEVHEVSKRCTLNEWIISIKDGLAEFCEAIFCFDNVIVEIIGLFELVKESDVIGRQSKAARDNIEILGDIAFNEIEAREAPTAARVMLVVEMIAWELKIKLSRILAQDLAVQDEAFNAVFGNLLFGSLIAAMLVAFVEFL